MFFPILLSSACARVKSPSVPPTMKVNVAFSAPGAHATLCSLAPPSGGAEVMDAPHGYGRLYSPRPGLRAPGQAGLLAKPGFRRAGPNRYGRKRTAPAYRSCLLTQVHRP
jgi:hypothetical protein